MTALLRYDTACRALAEAKAFDEVKDVHDKAMAMQLYARQANNRELESDAAVIRLRAQRRFGEMEIDFKAAGGMHRGGRPKTGSENEPVSEKKRLADLGVDKKFSAAAQKLAAVPEQEFECRLSEYAIRVRDEGARAAKDLLKAGDMELRRQQRLDNIRAGIDFNQPFPAGQFVVGIADPPWLNEDRPIGFTDRHYHNHYGTLRPDEVAALAPHDRPVRDLFGATALMALWITSHMLSIGAHVAVLEAWGFEPQTILTWDKQWLGLGYWVRDVTEHIVIATRGKPPQPLPADRPKSLIAQRRTTEHSAKPAFVHLLLEQWFPDVPRIELFARSTRPGWYVWGNEAEMVPSNLGEEILERRTA